MVLASSNLCFKHVPSECMDCIQLESTTSPRLRRPCVSVAFVCVKTTTEEGSYIQLQPTSSSKSKILRADSSSFEEEFYAVMLASDQSDSEGDIDEFLVSDHELLLLRESDQGEDLEKNDPEGNSSNEESQITQEEVNADSSDDDAPFSELQRSNYYYGKNRYK
ncbi:hypothetical protein EVAR_95064_1 [Eumeta japonica]|uniref:Uncharacterized protein n=1 Tax=Eumeta variegata TaxID=151549 RepID=A0A4C1W7U2_EUMVA|nr:hypothetical protein EVAR_95064_1 [Eumeta japonica]